MTTTRSSRLAAAAVVALLVASVIAIVSGGLLTQPADAQENRDTPARAAVVRAPEGRQAPDDQPPAQPAEADEESADTAEQGDVGAIEAASFLQIDEADLAAYEAFEECLDNIWDGVADEDELTDDAFEALDAQVDAECIPLLPEKDQAFAAAMKPFENCIDNQLGDDHSFDAFEAAEEACSDLLPAELAELDAAFEAFEQCLADNGVDLDQMMEFESFDHAEAMEMDGMMFGEPGNTVIVVTEDGEQIIELGDGASSVTITSDGESVTVDTDGDVEVIELNFDDMMSFGGMPFDDIDFDDMPFGDVDFDDMPFGDMAFGSMFEVGEEAFETCSPLLPESAMIGGPAMAFGF